MWKTGEPSLLTRTKGRGSGWSLAQHAQSLRLKEPSAYEAWSSRKSSNRSWKHRLRTGCRVTGSDRKELIFLFSVSKISWCPMLNPLSQNGLEKKNIVVTGKLL